MKKFLTTRRQFLKSSALTVGGLAAPAIIRSTSSQAQSGTVNVWTYANFIPDDFKRKFESETGIKVQIRLVDDQGKEFNLLAAEQPNPTADLVTVAGHRFEQFITSELIVPVDTGALKNWGTVNAAYRDAEWIKVNGETYGVPMLAGAEVLAYNTEMVPAAEVDSWAVMFDKKYRGQTAYTIQDMMSITMLYLGYDGTMVEYINDPEKSKAVVEEPRPRPLKPTTETKHRRSA